MSRIRILAEAVANKIAAGEVVERPASVVKELLENALDAGATVDSHGNGVGREADDSRDRRRQGMTHDDALLAFERHATTKLRTADDLLSIATLGFRGEALPTIAAVSRLVLETRDAAEAEGTRVEFAGGKLVGREAGGCAGGTSISVADLFYCVPARRKFLKSETTELGHIASLVTHYALAHPGKAFRAEDADAGNHELCAGGKACRARVPAFRAAGAGGTGGDSRGEAPFRAAITEPALEPEEETATLTRERIYVAAGSAAHESQRHLCLCEPAAGARPADAARDS